MGLPIDIPIKDGILIIDKIKKHQTNSTKEN